jgi:hypothetical protein
LKVTEIDPWAPISATPLFYLLSDQLDLLAELHRVGLPTVGRWTHRPDLEAGISSELAQLIDGRVVLWERVVEAWRVGRARPLEMAVIDVSGVVTPKMRPRVAEVLEEAKGDAGTFMEALNQGAVRNFRSDKKILLQETLEQESFLPRREPFDDAALVQQVRSQIAGQTHLDSLNASEIRQQILVMVRFLDRFERSRTQEEKD